MKRVRRAIAAIAVCSFAAANVKTQSEYLARSLRIGAGAATMIAEFNRVQATPPGSPVLVLDVALPAYPNLAAIYAPGHPTFDLPGSGLFAAGTSIMVAQGRAGRTRPAILDPVGMPSLAGLAAASTALYQPGVFPLLDTAGTVLRFRQAPIPRSPQDGTMLMAPAADGSVVNGSLRRPAIGRYYLTPLAENSNYLGLIDGDLAQVVAPRRAATVAMWQREDDFAGGGRGMQGIGRYLLFEVFNPVAGSQLLLDYSSASLAIDTAGLRRAAVIGDQRAELGAAAAGASRLLAPPVAPRIIGGRSYLAIDMGIAPQRFVSSRQGLAGMFNAALGLDPRRVAGFVRNISLLAPEQVRAMRPPAAVRSFPRDLFAPGLLFSGVYEDGWMSDVSRFRLQLPEGSRALELAGHVPGLGALQQGAGVTLLVDGEPVLRNRVPAGDFRLRAELPPSGDARWIEIRVDTVETLPGADRRRASLLLRSIALEP